MALHVHNTLTGQKDLFVPAHPRVVRLYSCGLTVYGPMHIGHARTYCFWDVFRRYLGYLGYHVVSVINYTDIDDRIVERAGGTAGALDLAERVSAGFRRDCRALRIQDYGVYTRATDFVSEQIEIAAELISRGHAYVVEGEVFYDVTSFESYGKLSGNKLDDQEVGASGRVGEDVSRKRHPSDFTLWKPSTDDQPSWETGHADWPSGRPGWHLECSAMSSAVLGASFDVHGGAVDNLFPHHENEIAQSEPLLPPGQAAPWVRYWMHPEHLDLRGVKMSKSIGNVIGVPDLLAENDYASVRWFFAMNHYRTRIPYTEDLVAQAGEGLRRIVRLMDHLRARLSAADPLPELPATGIYASMRPADDAVPRMRHQYVHGAYAENTERLLQRFREAMDDDLATPRATAAIFDYVNELYAAGIEANDDLVSQLAVYRALGRLLYVLGIEVPDERLDPELTADCMPVGGGDERSPEAAAIDRLVASRQTARAAKDFAKADVIRDVLTEAGIVVEDTPRGPRWEIG